MTRERLTPQQEGISPRESNQLDAPPLTPTKFKHVLCDFSVLVHALCAFFRMIFSRPTGCMWSEIFLYLCPTVVNLVILCMSSY